MTEKELKKLNRYQLLELLVAQTERADKLQKQVEELEAQLNERNFHFSQMGSIAEASVYLSGVFEAAQQAADYYVEAAQRQADEILAYAHGQAPYPGRTSGAYYAPSQQAENPYFTTGKQNENE